MAAWMTCMAAWEIVTMAAWEMTGLPGLLGLTAWEMTGLPGLLGLAAWEMTGLPGLACMAKGENRCLISQLLRSSLPLLTIQNQKQF